MTLDLALGFLVLLSCATLGLLVMLTIEVHDLAASYSTLSEQFRASQQNT